MTAKLVGFKRFTAKKNGQSMCVANIVRPYNPAENSRGSLGSEVKEVFMPQDQIDYLVAEDIGKDVELSYSIYGGRAYLDNLTVVGRK